MEEIFVDVIDPLLDDPHEGASKEEWAPRLARYLGYGLDGGILPEDIGLDDLCRLLANQGGFKPVKYRLFLFLFFVSGRWA